MEAESIAPSVSPTVTAGANKVLPEIHNTVLCISGITFNSCDCCKLGMCFRYRAKSNVHPLHINFSNKKKSPFF